MNICICGASGFIGRSLLLKFKNSGCQVTTITRNDFHRNHIREKLENHEILINLAGEPLNRRWTGRIRRAIYESRVLTTKRLVDAVNTLEIPLRLFINISAVGIYDSVHEHHEDSVQLSDGFLSTVVQDWEAQLNNVASSITRIVILRLGVVIGKEGGMFLKINRPYSWGIGFDFKMEKSFPVIHLKDLVRIFDFIIESKEISGVVNAVVPFRTNIRDFFQGLNRRRRPFVVLPVYKNLLEFIMGESAVLITEGQKVIPEILIGSGFLFEYNNMEKILDEVCNLKN
jgi:uncharacterized protein